MAVSYVQISRQELEDWLNALPWKWSRKANRAGIYFIHLSSTVGVKLNSTIGSLDDAVGRGKASMNLELVSLVTGHVLNRSARDRKHFKRTTNWKTNWKKGVEYWQGVYMKSEGFYDAVAEIEDRDAYKKDILARIENYPHWGQDQILADFHSRVTGGGVLTLKQKVLLEKTLAKKPKPSEEEEELPPEVEGKLQTLRELYSRARRNFDNWTMQFAISVANQLKAGRYLSRRQDEIVIRKLQEYGLY